MGFKNTLLGFDIREMGLSHNNTWSQERKDSFLLRQDLEKPLSADTGVWESVFNLDSSLVIPLEHQRYYGLWWQLRAMQAFIASHEVSRWKPSWVIVVTELVPDQYEETSFRVEPAEVEPQWSLLGYDVCQESLVSGLSGEAYERDEIQPLKERWAKHLNKYHLFEDWEQADQFADWADMRDPGSAPYFVFGLYLIRVIADDP
jgi:hypothetical protein